MKITEALATLEVRWFMSSMATGALGILWTKMSAFLHLSVLNIIGVAFLVLAFCLFLIASIGYAVRIYSFWENVKHDFLSPATSKFFAGISISLGVLSTGVSTVLYPQGLVLQSFAMPLAGAFYVLGMILGIFFLIGVCSQTIISHETDIKHAIGVCLLPPAGLFVNVFSGNFFAQTFFPQTSLAYAIGIFHFFLLGLLFLLTGFVLTFILFRLRFSPLPQKEMAPSFFIPLAPVGVSIIASVSLLPLLSESLLYKALLQNMLYLIIPALLSFGFFWLMIVLRVTITYIKKEGIPYTLGFWALVFPPSALGIGTFVAGGFLPGMSFLLWVGVFFGVLSLIIWLFVFSQTIIAITSGNAFVRPPCLKKNQ